MKSFANLLSSYIFISDHVDEDQSKPIYNMNVPAFNFANDMLNDLVHGGLRFHEFMAWNIEYGRSYTDVNEFKTRLAIFNTNKDRIEELQASQDFLSDDLHELGLNQFADWSDEEYQAMLMFHPDLEQDTVVDPLEVTDLPDSINWVT
jgi:hypothetical protein